MDESIARLGMATDAPLRKPFYGADYDCMIPFANLIAREGLMATSPYRNMVCCYFSDLFVGNIPVPGYEHLTSCVGKVVMQGDAFIPGLELARYMSIAYPQQFLRFNDSGGIKPARWLVYVNISPRCRLDWVAIYYPRNYSPVATRVVTGQCGLGDCSQGYFIYLLHEILNALISLPGQVRSTSFVPFVTWRFYHTEEWITTSYSEDGDTFWGPDDFTGRILGLRDELRTAHLEAPRWYHGCDPTSRFVRGGVCSGLNGRIRGDLTEDNNVVSAPSVRYECRLLGGIGVLSLVRDSDVPGTASSQVDNNNNNVTSVEEFDVLLNLLPSE
jgi:hypothetical protein